MADRNLMLAQRLAPDDLRQQFGNAPAMPDTLPDGSPDPNATAGWQQLYQDWQARGADMPPAGEWLRGAGGEYANALLMGTTAPGMRAFHGSPHSFERFDLGKIGTGEGAQAFGHGLYFAEREGTARGYRDKLSMTPLDHLNGELTNFHPYSPNGPAPTVANIRDMLAAHPDPHLSEAAADPAVVRDIATMVQGHDLNSGTWDDAGVKAASRLDTRFGNKTSGSMYEVNINADPEHYLHWDKPLSEQSPHVQEALAGLDYPRAEIRPSTTFGGFGVYKPGFGAPYATAPTMDAARALAAEVDKAVRGENLYQAIPGSHAEVSQALREAGIPGIRYLDQGSRAAGEGTHNLVVFDPATIEIMRKYGIAGLGLGGAAAGAAQQPDE